MSACSLKKLSESGCIVSWNSADLGLVDPPLSFKMGAAVAPATSASNRAKLANELRVSFRKICDWDKAHFCGPKEGCEQVESLGALREVWMQDEVKLQEQMSPLVRLVSHQGCAHMVPNKSGTLCNP